MRFSPILWALARFFVVPAIIGLSYIYLFPVVQLCSFPDAKPAEAACYFDENKRPAIPSEQAPFRLLAFGDPQLEGDTSLPDPNAPIFPSYSTLRDGDVRGAWHEFIAEDIPKAFKSYRKRLDLWGNDRYLAHNYWLVKWWTAPTHMVVLGDLLGSQWIGDEEFSRRSERFWGTVFKGARKVPDALTAKSGRREVLGEDDEWRSRIIAVAGNHDIGYAGDINYERIDRFEKTFGGVNWEIRFGLNETSTASNPFFGPSTPELRVVILNSMNLDGPALIPELQSQSLDFMRQQLHSQKIAKTTGTILLTHIPLHKEHGICVDGPLFNYFEPHYGGGIREQNHLSEGISTEILSGLIGADGSNDAIIVNGHDHWGCDVFHYDSPEHGDGEARWKAQRYNLARNLVANQSIAGMREVTARSMMGSFGGNAVLLSAWFDKDEQQWKFDYSECMLGVQHIWWGVHVLAIVVACLFVASVATEIYEAISENRADQRARAKIKQKSA